MHTFLSTFLNLTSFLTITRLKFHVATSLTNKDGLSLHKTFKCCLSCKSDILHSYSTNNTQTKHIHTAAYKPICAVSPPISSPNPVLKGPCQPAGYHASFFYCLVANYSNSIKKKRRRDKQRGVKTALFLCPRCSQEFYAFDFSFFQ